MQLSLIQTCVNRQNTNQRQSQLKTSKALELRNQNNLHQCSSYELPHPVQFADIYKNSNEDYLFKAQDMGWGHPFWANLRAISYINATEWLEIKDWLTLTMPYDKEAFLSTHLFKKEIDHIVARSANTEEPNTVMSTLFLRESTEINLPELRQLVTSLSGSKIEKINSIQLANNLKELLDVSQHHNMKNLPRIVISSDLKPLIAQALMMDLVSKARKRYSYLLCDGISPESGHLERLAGFMMADRSITLYSSPKERLSYAQNSGFVTMNEMPQLTEIVKQMVIEAKQWKYDTSYPGMPNDFIDKGENTKDILLWSVTKASNWRLEPSPLNYDDVVCPVLESIWYKTH